MSVAQTAQTSPVTPPQRYPVRERFLFEDAYIAAEQIAEDWQEPAYVYRDSILDGGRIQTAYAATTEAGLIAMRIGSSAVVTCVKPVDIAARVSA